MQLIIHRGARQVGGSCVELSHGNCTILLDVGLPLDSGFNDNPESHLPQPLFDDIRKGAKKISGVLLSHAHMDHCGLAGMLPRDIPLYCGRASAELMDITAKVISQSALMTEPQFFRDREPFHIGPFSITAYLMDHSAFDAYAFHISAGGKSIFYTGDFRAHGRKAKTFDRLINNPPHADVLLMEGTMVGPRSDETAMTEKELEEEFVRVITKTPGIVLVSTSGQNVDRLVTIFKAAQRTQRILVIDFYIAEILERLGRYANIPQASWPRIRVCYPYLLAQRFEKLGLADLLEKHRQHGIKWTRLQEVEDKAIMLVRPNFMPNIRRFLSLEGATWVYSMWPGYLEKSAPLRNMRMYFQRKGVRAEHIHTGGHATILELQKLAEAINASKIIPIHSFHSEEYKRHFAHVQLINDGEVLTLE
jgi:ribonuclease J